MSAVELGIFRSNLFAAGLCITSKIKPSASNLFVVFFHVFYDLPGRHLALNSQYKALFCHMFSNIHKILLVLPS